MATASKEQRRFYRHPLNIPIGLEVRGEKGPTESTDLSLGGISFVWKARITKGSSIHIQIPVREKLFEVRARVAYSREVQDHRYSVGAAFTDLPSAFRARLAEEIISIIEFQKSEMKKTGKEISEEEAAKIWIAQNAEKFQFPA